MQCGHSLEIIRHQLRLPQDHRAEGLARRQRHQHAPSLAHSGHAERGGCRQSEPLDDGEVGGFAEGGGLGGAPAIELQNVIALPEDLRFLAAAEQLAEFSVHARPRLR
jgi:hypothetical protein